MKQIRDGLTLAVISIFTYMGTGLAETVSGINELYAEEERPQEYCLALNMYFESRGSSVADMAGVSDVVLNRVKDARYPNTICEVIKQGPVRESWKTKKDPDLLDHERVYNPVRNKCQFSWYCDGKADIPLNQDLWHLVQNMAYLMIWEKKYVGITEGSTHYHAEYVNPRWANGLHLTGRIGKHIFYRWE
jgi:spore germination cell wall hydrolase CwlJ-like protein